MDRKRSISLKNRWATAGLGLRQSWQAQALFLACATICVIVPTRIAYNIDLKAMLVVAIGLVSWVFVLADWRSFVALIGRKQALAFGLFAVLALVGSLINQNRPLNLLGTPLVRLGAVEIVAAIGAGIWLLKIPARRLTGWLYITTLIVAAATVPYSYLLYGGFGRPGGAYYQADILAIVLGCGWFLGFEMLRLYRRHRHYLYASQAGLIAVLLITQTRAAIAIVAVLSLVWWVQTGSLRGKRLMVTVLIVAIGILLATIFLPGRLTDGRYADRSLSYRWSLQSAALHASGHRPLLGYGSANISTALACDKLTAPALRQTCHDGYFFDSSHNIFLDRVLAFGWPAGLIYMVIVLGSLWTSLRIRRISAFTLCCVAIAAYYLTNVTNVELELLFWIVLMRAYASTQITKTSR